jgi:hypothetical protein
MCIQNLFVFKLRFYNQIMFWRLVKLLYAWLQIERQYEYKQMVTGQNKMNSYSLECHL